MQEPAVKVAGREEKPVTPSPAGFTCEFCKKEFAGVPSMLLGEGRMLQACKDCSARFNDGW